MKFTVGSYLGVIVTFPYNYNICFEYIFLKKPGPWKRKCLAEFGIVTQCLAPTRVNDPYLLNLLMKINAKVWAYSPFGLDLHLLHILIALLLSLLSISLVE